MKAPRSPREVAERKLVHTPGGVEAAHNPESSLARMLH